MTDNLVDGAVVNPTSVRVHDDGDPYLVVAADRGTAAFSDLANSLAAEYGFWLGDAFASGGSAGYDHKALAITARGAWESVRHHFHEMGIDADTAPIRVIGIGDMSGDVFGNGMLLARNARLVAAFDHRHVFIDPDPDPAVAYGERARLFALPRSSWDDYDRSLLSPGGGVFPRRAKRVALSAEARNALGTEAETVTPDELIRIVLRAPVDLLWNGGIGTYVRATGEPDETVGDRTNDPVRVDASDLRTRVVVEGGNLGLTQRARIEYAERGGRIYTDFIDNSGGVHCSDREVNLKVLLALAVQRGSLATNERAPLIAELAPDVTERVVYENFLQAQILTQEQEASPHRLDGYEDLMVSLEQSMGLDRPLEVLPNSEEMLERGRMGEGMTAPELAVLLAYAKRKLADDLLSSDVPESDEFQRDLIGYFPHPVVERFRSIITDHPLRRDLIATGVANEVIDSEGITFVSRLAAETGATPPGIVRAYRIARDVTGAPDRWTAIEELEGDIPPAVQHTLMSGVDDLVEAITRWYLGRGRLRLSPSDLAAIRDAFARLSEALPDLGTDEWSSPRRSQFGDLVTAGVPEDVALRHAFQDALVNAPDIIELAQQLGADVEEMGRLSYLVADTFHLHRLRRMLREIRQADRWQRSAARTVEDDLGRLRRHLMERIIEYAGAQGAAGAVAAYVDAHRTRYDRVMRLMRSLTVERGDDLASVVVAVRRIERLFG